MLNINICKKKLIASILCANTILLTMPVNIMASEISGVTPTGNTYNIEAAKVSGSTGFRHYDKFNLTQGDIANLKFKDNYSKFVNLVDNKISINGIVNTMKGNSFYNGHAIFVSPNGMVVGASGLLNVGSLSVLTPNQNSYNLFKSAYEFDNLSQYEHNAREYNNLIKSSDGQILINGKILARNEVNLYGSDISIGNGTDRAGIVAGYTGNDSFSDYSTAESTFNSLVSNNITNANSFALSDGKLQIVANKESNFGAEAGNIKANITVKNADIGANEIDISSTAKVDRQERIDLAEAKVNIENSNITGDTVSITANAVQKKNIDSASLIDDGRWIANALTDLFESDTPSIGSLWGVAGKAEADVTIKNSTINALKATASDAENPDLSVYIHSESSSETSENANFLTPSIIDFIKNDESKISEYFSSGVYSGFEGARSSATVNVENTTINAISDNAKNVEISTDASSSLEANNRLLAMFLPIGMYGTGTETVSKAIVKDSTLNVTKGDIDLMAVSSNENAIELSNDSIFSIKLEDSYIGMMLNNTVKTDTEALITSSKVNANNLTVLANNISSSESDVTMEAMAGMRDQASGQETHGNSAISIVALMNRSENNVSALIKDSEINTEEDTVVLAQSLNVTNNSADASINDRMVKSPKTFDKKWKDFLKEKQYKYFNVNIFDKIRGKTNVVANQSATLEAGGVLVWNETNNHATAKIENSTVTAGDVNVQANTVDLLANSATSDTQGEGKYGISLSVIYNIQNNTTNALIDKSTVEADNVVVDSTTELPMNQGKLTFGLNLPFKIAGVEKLQFGGKFASEANGKWDVSAVYPNPEKEEGESNFEVTGIAEQNIRDSYSGLKPKVRLSGFFNNMAQTNSVGSNASVSAAVVYNEVNNNTIASIINGSDITINEPEGALTVNAVNTVMGYNGLGLFDFLIKKINYKIPGQEDWEYEPTVDGGKFGLGANFAWDSYTNNATALIDNSNVIAEKGVINVDSANEQSYFNIVMTGGKSEALGIDGSIHVQNLKGDTIAKISNVTGDNTVKAKNISVNAGKAHIKTTAGKVERDDDTNQAKWKVQNQSASGDEKYVREAKDEITNIIAQGAWTSQYEEIDNTVQENSAGVAVGASVNVSDTDRTVKATIENANVETSNDLTVNADTYTQKIDAEVAAAFSGGVTQAESEVQNVQQNANNAQDDEDNIFGNLFDGEDEYMRNPVGNNLADLQGQFSMSLAGAVDVTTDNTKAEAYILNSTVDAGNNLTVNSNRESKIINVGGGLAKSKKVGAGAAVNVYKQEGTVKSYINGSTVTFSGNNPELKIESNNKNWILDIAVGAGAAVNTAAEGKGFQSAVGGSASVNTLKPTIEAYINKSTIDMADGKTGNINTTLNAKNDVDIINIAGGGSYMKGGSSGLSAGAAFNYNNVKNTIKTYIQDSTLNNIGALTLLADADNNLNDFAVAGSIVTGTDGAAFTFAGGIDVDYIHDTITSKVINSTITATDDIDIKANSKSDNLAVAGTFDVTTAKTGAGVNGDVVVNVYRNDITSEIDSTSKILKAKDVKVSATSVEKSDVIPVGVSVATGEQWLMTAANVGVNVIDNSVKAYVSGDIGVDAADDEATNVHDVKVAAYDETTLYSRGGTLALASADSIANIAGSVNVDKIDKTVEAKIKDADIKAGGEVEVLANSVNSLGGTKENGQYSRDDVTTDAYKDKMLNKNDKGEYDDLKLGNDFKNWNMFYNIAAGANISVSGAGIGKVIENNITAEINNSKVVADDLSIIAKDYSVKNIIAGSISASSKAAAGLQTIYTRDNSTTNALITGGSNLSIDNSIDLLANNVKDSYEILIAGSGAGKGVINANVVLNNISDRTNAKIDNSSSENIISAEKININSNEDINQSHIIVTAGGAQNLALSVSPTINNYDMTTESVISNTTIQNSSVDMDSQSKIDTLDISVGVAGVGQGLAGTGIAIENNYTNTVKSYIDNSTINTAKTIDIDANSIINSNNWIAAVSVAGQGVSVVTNVLLNNITSTLEAGIKNSTIEKSGAITINTNKDKKDKISNKAIGLGVAGEGASALVNVVQNIYKNTVLSYVDNTASIDEDSLPTVDSLTLNSNSNRDLNNINIGVSVAGIGASLLANALVNQIDSSTVSSVDVKDKSFSIENALNVDAKDNTESGNTMAMVNGAGLGAAAGANINLYYANNLAKAEVKSSSNGQINANSSNITSNMINGLDNDNVAVSLGAGAIAGDVALVKLGKRTSTYSESEKSSKINDAVSFTQQKYNNINSKLKDGYKVERDSNNVEKYYTVDAAGNKTYHSKEDSFEQSGPSLYTPTSSDSEIETGSIARIDGNIKTKNNTSVKAESKLKGLGNKDTLSLTNVNVSAGLGTIGVGVKNTQIANNTLAEIAGGKVESEAGNVSVNAESKSNVDITNARVDVSGVSVSGGSAIYNNTSETVAQIKNATVNASGNIDVVSKSTSNSNLDSTNVVVTGGQIVAVDLAETKDTNKSIALISGNTNIDSDGKLTVHSTTNTDLKSTKSTVTVSGAGIVSVSKNDVEASTISKAIIENVEGTIKANGIDITTDYDTMSALSKANVTSIKFGDVASVDTSGAKMTADFKSGIDSSGLTLTNSGDTNITTAKSNGTEGVVSKSEINNVHVSLQGFVASTSANAENNATSETVLNVGKHSANNLNINSYLDSKAISNAGATKATVGIGVNTVDVDAKDISTLKMTISGDNTISQNAIINATHNSEVNSDMSAFNFSGIIGGGQRVRITSVENANTTGNVGGNFDANSTNITFNTIRNSVMSKSSGSGGGVVNVNDTKAENKLTGSSILTIDGFESDTKNGINNLVVKHTSTNTFDITSSNGSGGLINISEDSTTNELTTSTTTNINNSIFNSDKEVSFEVSNNTIVKDSASMGAGGFVAVADNEATNTYTASAKLSLNNTTINAENINLKTNVDVRNAKNTIVDYAGGAGGFVAENEMRLTNNINQTSEIEIKNSKLYSKKDTKLKTITSSLFKQKTDTTVGGFVAIPRSKNWLTVTNNNQITIDALSKVVAADELEINFDSNNDLEARAISEAHHFGFKDPVSESYLTLNVNNTLQNNGSLEAGNLVDINFMNDSTNNLTQYAYSEAHAAIPTTTEEGEISKNINNILNVEQKADITSGKDIEISYSVGKGTNSSTIAWKTICYALFGIPISDSGSHSNVKVAHTVSLKDDGKIVAGQGNSRYMKINRDGSIDKETLKGFYDDDYILSDGEHISGSVVKQRTLNSIQVEINNIQETIEETTNTINSLDETIIKLEDKQQEVQDKIDELNDLINNGAILTNDKRDTQGNSDFDTFVQNEIKTEIKSRIVDDSDDTKITESQYNTIMSDYDAKLAEITVQNEGIDNYNAENVDNQKPYIERPTIFDFLNENDYGLSEDQKQTIIDAYDAVNENLSIAEKTGFAIYQKDTVKYVAVTNPIGTGTAQTCDEITIYNEEIDNIKQQIKPYSDKKIAIAETKTILETNKTKLENEYDEVEATPENSYEQHSGDYSITFNDITPKDAHITVDGAYNPNITGSGIFSVASNGLKIDNYSTRTLMFKDLIIDSVVNQSGLIIGGKNHSEFADKNQEVSGMDAYRYIQNIIGHKSFNDLPTTGVHYESGGDGISGITVNNYYDVNHPFASTFDIIEPTTQSQIIILGDVNTASKFNIWNESGNIFVGSENNMNYSDMSLISTNGNVSYMIYNENDTTPINIKADDYIFGKKGFAVVTNKDINIQGTIETGYSDKSITITDEMIKPENLIYDPTSGETNMINLGGDKVSFYLNDTNNIKAIYKDGEIYLYNLPKSDSLSPVSFGNINVTLSGEIKIANGLQNITIDNQTNAQLNIADITNSDTTGFVHANNLTKTDGGKVTINTVDYANTNITSKGKLSLNGVIKNSTTTNYDDFPKEKGILNITADNGLEVKQKVESVDYIPTIVDSILANGKTNIILNNGQGDINGNITSTGELNIFNKGTGALNLTGDIKNDASRKVYPETLISKGLINITNENTGVLNINSYIEETEGNIKVQSNAQTNISSTILNNKGNIEIASKGLSTTNDSDIQDIEGDISITNNASNLNLEGYISSEKGNISITNNGNSADIAGKISDDEGDLTITNTKGDMTISSVISHNKNATDKAGMIAIINETNGGKLDINSAIETAGIGKTETDTVTGETKTTAILIDNQSSSEGMSISNIVKARIGDIIIKNAVDELSISGDVADGNGNIDISNQSKTEISGNITTQDGNVDITSVGLDTTENSVVTTNKGDITVKNVPYYDSQTDTTNYGTMNLAGDIRDFNGIINIDSYHDAIVGGYITDEKGYVIIRNLGGEMTVSGDVNLNYLNNNEEGFISIGSLSSGKKLDITGNIINWGEGHTSQSGKYGINISNTTSNSEGINISGMLSARTGIISVENEHGKLTTTSDANISNTENGAISIINTGKEGAEIRGNIIATDGNIGISNTRNDLLINADITEKKGNINITNFGKSLTYLGNTLNELGDTKVVNNGTGIAQIGADIQNNGNVTINNNRGENLVFDGSIDNIGNTLITNNNGFTHVYGNITNKNGSIIIKNEGVFTEITSAINNDTGSIGISNKNGHLKITDTAEINNTSDRENSNITIVNFGEDTPGNLMIDGNINSYDKGYIDIINNGNEAHLTGDIFAKDGNIGITNSNSGKLAFTGNIVDYKGDVTLINNGDDGAEIGGTILDEKGDISIINHGGDLKVSSEITHNYLNRDSEGMISITNSSNAGKVEIDTAVIATDGAGKTDEDGKITAILIDNQSTDYGMSLNSTISARIGDIVIKNASNDLSTLGMISNYEQGDINITNSGKDYTNTADIINKLGDVNITNNGTGMARIGGSINNQEGDTTIDNKGKNLEVSGKIDNAGGNTSITNIDGLTRIVGDITNKDGNTVIANSGEFTEITSTIVNEAGSIHISNSNGNLNINDSAKILNTSDNSDDSITIANAGGILNLKGNVESSDKGDIEITNTGNGKANIEGNVVANEGDIDISNSNTGELYISGNVVDYNGNIDITNDSNDGMKYENGSVVENVKGNTTITNNQGDITVEEGATIKNTESGNIVAENKGGKFTIAGLLKHFGIGNTDIDNTGDGKLEVATTGVVEVTDGNIDIKNSNTGALEVAGNVINTKGKTTVTNTSDDGILIATTGTVNNKDGNIEISNTGTKGIDVNGFVRTDKQNIIINNKDSDIRIGELESENDNYINAVEDNVIINQENGNILNGIVDSDTSNVHQNADFGNPDQSYKTLISTGKDLSIAVTDGDVGYTSNDKPGFSIDATTRDYTESINVNINGSVIATALNENNDDKRLINIRAKDSDLNVENVKADGNVILTASDWKQPDETPAPDNEDYFIGYSILNASKTGDSPVTGQNISVIASNLIGTSDKPFEYTQDTKTEPKSSVSFEAENDINLVGKANSDNPTKINQLISKKGNIDFTLGSDAEIREITSGDHLHILQKAKNLTIYDLGMAQSSEVQDFNDILYPHDGIKVGGKDEDSVIPQSVAIEVLDSKGGNNADSTLKIYSAQVKGRNNGQGEYDENGRQVADISIMADNVYANSSTAPNSTVETKANPNGYKQKDKTYSDSVFGIEPSTTYDALGFNAYGEGTALSFDIKGVNKDFVKENAKDATRTNYNKVKPAKNVPDIFKNDNNKIKDYDYKADNVVISVNDNVNTDRSVNLNSIYADNAYVDTTDSKLEVKDGYITNYAEFRNADKIGVVDNDYRRIVKPADIQLYTEKTGSFELLLKDTINMHTTAPTVYNEPHMLVNGYHSSWNFVNRGRKEAEHQIENIELSDVLQKKYEEEDKRISMRFDTTDDDELISNFEIYDISTTGALIKNDGTLKIGDEIDITLQFEDVDVNVKAKVVNIKDDKAGVEFIRLPKAVASKILYRYMKQANSMKTNLTSMLK